ncbi:MAG: hypothetical protein KKB30_12975 [Proteobacteria bacterium]|nr:hypothetical protein [Pseudomonadota bacterium]MBU1714882.1 hypothetical protein [Pseudomonadota bacterium]
MTDQKGNPRIKAMILEVVANQIRENDPPETKRTYNRLIQEGHSDEDARCLIGSVVAIEVFDILKKKEAFNLTDFVQALNNLPELPIGEIEISPDS